MTTEALIKPATIEEQLLCKVRVMRQQNKQEGHARAQEQYLIDQNKKMNDCELILIDAFSGLSKKYFGISKNQIKELTNEEFEALFALVTKRANVNPLFGWILKILGFFDVSIDVSIKTARAYPLWPRDSTTLFIRSISELKKGLGDSFNPVKFLYENLGKQSRKEEEEPK